MDKNVNTWNQSETLYAFMGWLTCRNKPVTLSASHDASPAVELITQFMKRHNLPELREGWADQIIPEE